MRVRVITGLCLSLLSPAAPGETTAPLDPAARNDAFQPAPAPVEKQSPKKNETLERPKLDITTRTAPVNKVETAKLPTTAVPAKDAVRTAPKPAEITPVERKVSPLNGRLAPVTTEARKQVPATSNVYQGALEGARTVTIHKNVSTAQRAGVEEINGFVITREDPDAKAKEKGAIPVTRAGGGETAPKP